MKKLLWIVGGFFVVLLVVAITVPFFVNVDQYRPQIEAQANQRINGKLTLGPLKLSLWGKIKINAASIRVDVNGFPQPLLETQQFHLEVPVLSILSGKPKIVAVLEEPRIEVLKETNGKMNALELMNTPALTNPQAAAAPANPGATSANSGGAQVPGIVAGATLGLRIEKGELHYQDKLGKSDYRVKGLDLDAQNLGLGSPMNIKLRAPLEGKSPSFSFSGPVEMQADLQPVLVGTSVKSARGKVFFDATELKVDMPGGTFRKSVGMPLAVKAEIEGNDTETILKIADIQFHDFHFFLKGQASMQPMKVVMHLTGEPVNLAKVRDFVPMLAEYDLKGMASLRADAEMDNTALKANGDVKVTGGSVFPKAYLKAPLDFLVQATFTENSLNLAHANVSGPDSDLELTGSVKNFFAPQFSFSLAGKSLNVDKTLVLPASAKTAGGKDPAPAAPPPPVDPAKDVNPMAGLAKNPILAKADGQLAVQIGKVVAYGTTLDQVMVKSTLKNMVFDAADASLHTFGGVVKANATADLKPTTLPYSTAGSVSGISGKEAVKQYFPKFQNTVDGTVNAKWNVKGQAYPSTARIRSLSGTANLMAVNGALKSVDVQGTLNSVMQKVPFLKGKPPVTVDDGFKTMTANVNFVGGEIRVDPIEVQPRNKGFVLKGKSTIQENLSQETFLDVYDPQKILPQEIEVSGKPAIALRLTGPLSGPSPDYGYTLSRLAKNAGTSALKNAAGKALDKALGGSGGNSNNSDALKNAADKLKKKFKLPF